MRGAATWARRWWWILVGLLAVALVLSIGLVFSLVLIGQTSDLLKESTTADLRRSAFQYQADNLTKIWTTIVQAIVGVVLAVGAVATWRNLRVAQDNLEETKRKAAVDREAIEANLKVTHARLDSDREAQITNRFTQAIGQLGAELKDGQPNMEVRLGGIYALQRIAKDSPRDHWTIVEILTAYVRQNARWTNPDPPDGVVSSPEDLPPEQPQEREERPPLRTDIQAILTVIGRRIRSEDPQEPGGLDLHRSDLRLAELAGAHLQRAVLWDAHLEQAILTNAHLEEAELWGVHLEYAHLEDAHLEGAYLSGACLQRAHLSGAHLEGAGLIGAHLEGASLIGAHLQGAFLRGAHLEGSHLGDAHLEQADNLTQDQVYSAVNHGHGAFLPADWPPDWRDRLNRHLSSRAQP